MGYVISFAITVLMVLLALAIIMRVKPLRNLAGLGSVTPGPVSTGGAG